MQKKTDWNDVIERGLWTAVQAFVGAITTTELAQAVADIDISGMQAIALSGAGAGVAALVSFIKTVAQERLTRLDTRRYKRS